VIQGYVCSCTHIFILFLCVTPIVYSPLYRAGILEGLHYMHIRSIAHRDMKPENVLISKDGFPIIVDLGFAKEIKDKSYTLCGSPLYIAPENILGKGHDMSCDYWSWACMIHEMLTGTTPFELRATDQSSLFKAIIKQQYDLSGPPVAVQLIRKVLVRPQQRLGNLAGGTRDLKEHAWFKNDVDFVKLANKDSGVPWKPKVDDPLDAAEFHNYYETEANAEPLTKRDKQKFAELDELYAKLKQEDKRATFQNWLSQRSL
jgi:serine/threonine protein kinase